MNAGEIGSFNVSANPPSVTDLNQNGGGSLPAKGSIQINWQGSDVDNDSLFYTLLYSPDDRFSWYTLADGLDSNSFELPLDDLQGTKAGFSEAWFKVVANDGVLTGIQEIGPFSVVNKEPVAEIHNPLDGATFSYEQHMMLEGYGQDIEEGTLSDDKLIWSSDLDGYLGNGHLLDVSLLQVGTHMVTLTVVDSSGLQDTDQITIHVEVEIDQISPQLAATPTPLTFFYTLAGNPPASQMLSIRNLGDGILHWTATANADWISLSVIDGSTPEEIEVGIDTNKLPGGKVAVGEILLQSEAGDFLVPVNVTAEGEFIFLPAIHKP